MKELPLADLKVLLEVCLLVCFLVSQLVCRGLMKNNIYKISRVLSDSWQVFTKIVVILVTVMIVVTLATSVCLDTFKEKVHPCRSESDRTDPIVKPHFLDQTLFTQNFY